MKAGRMRHWLRLEKPAITKDAFGAPLKTFAAVATVDAAIDSISGREYMAADREIGGLQWRITLRELPGEVIEPGWRGVEVDGDTARVFDIVAILPSHFRNELTVAATSGQSQP
jgi:head-tail adaptor